MPHCIIEYSADLERYADRFVDRVSTGLLAMNLFEEHALKTRACSYAHFRTGREQSSFIHITLKLFSGRSDEQKQALAHAVLDSLAVYVAFIPSVTIAVEDINRATYAQCYNGRIVN